MAVVSMVFKMAWSECKHCDVRGYFAI